MGSLSQNVINEISLQLFKDAYPAIKKISGVIFDKIIKELEVGYESYLRKGHEKYSYTKTFLSINEKIAVDDIFVMPAMKLGERLYNFSDISDFVRIKSNFSLIIANAGAGKTMLLRKIFLEYIRVNQGVFPIFVSLRDVKPGRPNFMHELFRVALGDFDDREEKIVSALVGGAKLLLLLDGFDEVDPKYREEFLEEIDSYTNRNPNLNIVISSRPVERLAFWNKVDVYSIQDFDIDRIISLVEKSPIKANERLNFSEAVINSYYESHGEYLANPLLCNMMILTYIQGGDIPNQLHLFYKKAFNTMFKLHDDSKFLFRRVFHTNIAEDYFVRLWNTFCYITYINRQISMSYDDVIKRISDSINYCKVECDKNKLLTDFSESLSILIRDGSVYTFLHRSFQEYGAAEFICNNNIPDFCKSFNYILSQAGDNVAKLAHKINPDKIDKEYFLPESNKYLVDFRRAGSFKEKVELFFSAISFREEGDELYFYIHQGDSGRPNYINLLTFTRIAYDVDFVILKNSLLQEWWIREGNELIVVDASSGSIEIELNNVSARLVANSPLKLISKNIDEMINSQRSRISSEIERKETMLKGLF